MRRGYRGKKAETVFKSFCPGSKNDLNKILEFYVILSDFDL
jgi:hypothetical protein